MGKCWGITKKLRFCRSNAGENWFCHKHTVQPRYFLIVALTGIAFSYFAGLIPKPWKVTITHDPLSQQLGTLEPKYARANNNIFDSHTGVGTDQSSQIYAVQLSEGTILQPFGRYAPFSISKNNNGLLISAIVRSLDGKVVAKIYDNKWVLNPNNYFRNNFDKSALEVIDEYDIPVLQVEYLDESRIKVGGLFYLEENEISEVYSDFPCTPKDMNPRAVVSFRGSIMIVGKGGYLTISKETSPMELRKQVSKVKIEPWFDYSEPDKLGIRKQTER